MDQLQPAAMAALQIDRIPLMQTSRQETMTLHPEVYYYRTLVEAAQTLLLLDHRRFSPSWCERLDYRAVYGQPYICDPDGNAVLELYYQADLAQPGIFLLAHGNADQVRQRTGIDLDGLSAPGRTSNTFRLSYQESVGYRPTTAFARLQTDLREQVAAWHRRRNFPFALYQHGRTVGNSATGGKAWKGVPVRGLDYFGDEVSAIQAMFKVPLHSYIPQMLKAAPGEDSNFAPVVIHQLDHRAIASLYLLPIDDGRRILLLRAALAPNSIEKSGILQLPYRPEGYELGQVDTNRQFQPAPSFESLRKAPGNGDTPGSRLNMPCCLTTAFYCNDGSPGHFISEESSHFPDVFHGLFHMASVPPAGLGRGGQADGSGRRLLYSLLVAPKWGIVAVLDYQQKQEPNFAVDGLYLSINPLLHFELRSRPAIKGMGFHEDTFLLLEEFQPGSFRMNAQGLDFYKFVQEEMLASAIAGQANSLLTPTSGQQNEGYQLSLFFTSLQPDPDQLPRTHSCTQYYASFESAFRTICRLSESLNLNSSLIDGVSKPYVHAASICPPAFKQPMYEQAAVRDGEDGNFSLQYRIDPKMIKSQDKDALAIVDRIIREGSHAGKWHLEQAPKNRFNRQTRGGTDDKYKKR